MSAEDETSLTPRLLLRAYAVGVFPMAESADDPALHWVEPKLRGIIPLDNFHLSNKLARLVKGDVYRVVVNQDFDAVITACAAPRSAEGETWINGPIRKVYRALFDLGHVHTVEVRTRGDDRLVGGLYGVSLGAAFFGESMFHRERDCSKLALVHLVARLRAGGFTLLDTQFVTDHLRQFGAIEVPRTGYRRLLDEAIRREANFHCWPADGSVSPDAVLATIRT